MKLKKRVLVLSRKHISNYGDPIIGDCCKYVIEKTARHHLNWVEVDIEDVYEKDEEKMRQFLHPQDVVVFPGGGLNSVKFNKIVIQILKLLESQDTTKVCFNACGILKINPKENNERLLEEMFNRQQVIQITTRGDYDQLLKYIHSDIQYPSKLVFDPAIWVNEAYKIRRNRKAQLIGIGVIRPKIFESNGNEFSTEDVFDMYAGIIAELEDRGYEWKLFTNGMREDYQFGVELLERLGKDQEMYLGKNVKNGQELVKKIANFKGIIAARLHANIIATSLRVPSIGLVWNDKMNIFGEMIGCSERYIDVEHLLDSTFIVDRMEEALEQGYDEERIRQMKGITEETIYNIIKA